MVGSTAPGRCPPKLWWTPMWQKGEARIAVSLVGYASVRMSTIPFFRRAHLQFLQLSQKDHYNIFKLYLHLMEEKTQK